MVDEKQLRDIIQQVLGEMDVTKDSQGKVGVQQAVPRTKDVKEHVEAGSIPDVSEVDIRRQYLVEHPQNREAYYEIKQAAPCRLGIGKAGRAIRHCRTCSFARHIQLLRMPCFQTLILNS